MTAAGLTQINTPMFVRAKKNIEKKDDIYVKNNVYINVNNIDEIAYDEKEDKYTALTNNYKTTRYIDKQDGDRLINFFV